MSIRPRLAERQTESVQNIFKKRRIGPGLPMTALGQSRRFRDVRVTSAHPPKRPCSGHPWTSRNAKSCREQMQQHQCAEARPTRSPRWRGRLWRLCVRAARQAHCKTEPLPGSLVTVTSPPIMRASLRVMARPRPVPPKRCAVVASAWVNSSNSFACCSGVMPMPVSATASSTQPRPLTHLARPQLHLALLW